GNVLVLAPWNYPMQLLFAPMVAAIAAGNTVVLKPSEHAPHTARVSQRVIEDNFAPEYAAVVQGEADVSRQLIQQGFDYLFFTGSPAVGRMVMSAAAEHLTPVTLELGGKSPVVVDRSADIGVAARKIAWGKFNNAGQTCVAPDYILVHESAAEELTAKLRETIIDFYGRNPAGSKDYGRIVNDRQFERLHRLLDTSPVVHGGSFEAGTRYIEPTVMYPVQWSDPIMQEEIFGPILPVLTYSSLDDAIERIRGFDRPLALYVFARNRQVEKRVIHEIPFGGGGVNCTLMHVGSSKLPFGGIGSSGMGRYHGKAGFDTFSHFKSILSQPGSFDLPIVYPGKQISMKLLRKLIR
ncbi:MAG: aldehyde dehydrogenase family protein, partial [Spirochaeta sp.]